MLINGAAANALDKEGGDKKGVCALASEKAGDLALVGGLVESSNS